MEIEFKTHMSKLDVFLWVSAKWTFFTKQPRFICQNVILTIQLNHGL